MCLQTTWKKPRRALKSFIVYKLVDNATEEGCMSPYEGFPYRWGKTYSTKIQTTEDDGSFDDLASEKKINCEKPYISIAEGFHAALEEERFELEYYGYKVVKCRIPKGALYYKGLSDLIVSDKIVLLSPFKKK